jgi:hypothetical protein
MVRPRIAHYPAYSTSAGREAVDLARFAGLQLDDWQAFVLEHSLGELPNGRWAARDIGCILPRQNGKNAILEARELAGLFLLNERLIVHTAHEGATAAESMRRLEELIEGTPEFSRRVKNFWHANGKEAIELMNGQRIRFRTRTKGGGRGFSADCVIFDEAMILPDATVSALLPTLSARPNPQVWFTGSAVDQAIHEHGLVLARIRERGHRGDPNLAYFEWSAEFRDAEGREADPSALTAEQIGDRIKWREANPALGVRIEDDDVEAELVGMDNRGFAVERLGVGSWPSTDPAMGSVIDLNVWRSLADAASKITGPVTLSFDVTPDRAYSSICAAGRRADGLLHVQVIERRPGTGWVVDRVNELRAEHRPHSVVCDGNGPASSLAEAIGNVTVLASADYVRSCGAFFDLVSERGLRHLGTGELDSAIRGAAKRPLVDAWAWSRKSSAVDISPLVGVTLAAWGASTAHDVGPMVAFA